MHKKSLKILKFEAAVALARTDPDAFEKYRRDVIEALIARAPERNQQPLRCLQWRIDQERRRAPNPIAACVKLYRMMWESFAGESGLVSTLRNAQHASGSVDSLLPKAKILSFPGTAATKNPSES